MQIEMTLFGNSRSSSNTSNKYYNRNSSRNEIVIVVVVLGAVHVITVIPTGELVML